MLSQPRFPFTKKHGKGKAGLGDLKHGSVWGIHFTSQSSSELLLSQFENEVVFRSVCVNVERNKKTPGRLIHRADFRVGMYPVSGPRLTVRDPVSEWNTPTAPSCSQRNEEKDKVPGNIRVGVVLHERSFLYTAQHGIWPLTESWDGVQTGPLRPPVIKWLPELPSQAVLSWQPGMGLLTPSLEMLRPEDHIASLLVSQLVYLKRTSSFWTW